MRARCSSSTRPSGGILLEMLVALLLFSVVLVVAADLLHRSYAVNRRVQAQAPADQAWTALLEVSRELDGALTVLTPTGTGDASQLHFRRVDDTASRLPGVPSAHPSPVPTSFDPFADLETVTVQRTAAGELTCAGRVLATGVEAFVCRRAGRQLTLEALVQGRTVRVVHSLGAWVP